MKKKAPNKPLTLILIFSISILYGIFSFVWGANGKILSGETKTDLSISSPSQSDRWTFYGNAGNHVIITAVGTSGELSPEIFLYPPDGGSYEASSSENRIDYQLKQTGQYTIVVSDLGMNDTGTYNISLLKIPGTVSSTADPDGGEITSDQTLSGTINVPSDLDAFQFSGSAGDRVIISTVVTSGELYEEIFLYPPDGGTFEDSSSSSKIEHTLSQTGLYTIVVSDLLLSDLGDYNISLTIIPKGSSTTTSSTTTTTTSTTTTNTSTITTTTTTTTTIPSFPLYGTIKVTTNFSLAAFTITGPVTYEGLGTSWSQNDASAGNYTITYQDVSGYETPESETKYLSEGGSLTFKGIYTKPKPKKTEITCEVAPLSLVLGNSITIRGSIKPQVKDFVEIYLKTPSENPFYLESIPTSSSGEFTASYTPNATGSWSAIAKWSGDINHKGSESNSASFDVKKAKTDLTLNLTSNVIILGNCVDINGKLTPLPDSPYIDLAGIGLNLNLTSPDGATSTKAISTDSDGTYSAKDICDFNKPGTWKVNIAFKGDSNYSGSSSPVFPVIVSELAGYAIILEGKIPSGEGIESHNKTTNKVYAKLIKQGFLDENIYYFNYDKNQQGVDDVPSKEKVKDTIENWAKDKLNQSPAPLFIIFTNHGSKNSFDLDEETITPQDLNQWLTTLESGLTTEAQSEKRVFIYGACYSGSFIPKISKEGRVVITSAAENEESYKGPIENDGIRDGEFFISELLKWLGNSSSLTDAFKKATDSTEIFTRIGAKKSNKITKKYFDSAIQHPLLDDNGDKIGSNELSETGSDGEASKKIYLGSGSSTTLEITGVTPSQTLGPSETETVLWAKVNDTTKVDSIWIGVRKPDITLKKTNSTEQKEVDLTWVQDSSFNQDLGRYEFTGFTDFTLPGTYEIYYFAKDKENGELSSLKITTIYKSTSLTNPPSPFNLLSPEDGVIEKTSLTFTWKDSKAKGSNSVITYSLIIATDKDFKNVVYIKDGIEESFALVDKDAHLKDLTAYYWKALAIDSNGKATNCKKSFRFKTNNTNYIPSIISGRVFDKAGNPIEKAKIKISKYPPIPTLKNGSYYKIIPPGKVKISVNAKGFSKTPPKSVKANPGEIVEANFELAGKGKGK